MSVLENFEQRISEAQSNKDCEGIISDICSSTKLHNKDRRELLEKIISSPKFEKPSKKLCAEFYTALTEMYNDGVLELIYKFSQKNGYEYSKSLGVCVATNTWPGRKATEALIILEKAAAASSENRNAYFDILYHVNSVINEGKDEDNRIAEQEELICKILKDVPSGIMLEDEAEIYTDTIKAFSSILNLNNPRHVSLLLEHLDYAAKNIKHSFEGGDNISVLCGSILKDGRITPDIEVEFLNVLNTAALNGNSITGDVFGFTHNEQRLPVYVNEINKIERQLKQKNISSEFCDYALLLANEFSVDSAVDKNVLLSLVQSAQENKTSVSRKFISLCIDLASHDKFRDEAVAIFHKEVPFIIKQASNNRDILGYAYDFYETLPDDYPDEKIIPDILLLAKNTSNNFCPLLIKRGYYKEAFECIKDNVANFKKVKEPKRQLIQTYYESILDIVDYVINQPDNEEMMRQVLAEVKKLAHSHCQMKDAGTIPPYSMDRILATVLRDCPQLSDECIKIWKIYVSALPEKCQYASMLNCLEQVTAKSKAPSEHILAMFEVLPEAKTCEDKIAALKFFKEFASHFPEQAEKCVKLVKDKKVSPEFWMNDEKYCNNRWNYREISIGLEAYKSFLLSVGDKMPNVFVEFQLAEEVKKYFVKSGHTFRDGTNNHLLWQKKYSDIETEYKSLTGEEKIHINRILSSKNLSTDEKMALLGQGADFCKDFNIGIYLNIKKYILEKEENANIQWVIPSAIACAKIYGKEYMNYFRIIENYNEQVPKIRKEFWKKTDEYEDKKEELAVIYVATGIISKTLENLPNSKLLAKMALRKNLLMYELDPRVKEHIEEWKNNVLSSPDFNIKSERRRLEAKRKGLLGTIYATFNYMEEDDFQPIGLEKATSWMVKTVNAKADFEKVRKFADKNIKARNIVGQPFLRINAPHLTEERRLRTLDDICRDSIEFSDDFSLVIPRLKYLTDKELVSMKYSEIYEKLSKINFDYTCQEFAVENSSYVDSQEAYDEAEVIYYKGLVTPSRFADKPIIYNDNNTFRCMVASKEDVRTLFVGEKTSCCQSYGDVGGSCAVDSVTNPSSGCLIFESRKSEAEPWKIVGCSWFYESQNGGYKGLTFDNVEVETYGHYEEQVKSLFLKMTEEFARDNYKYITVGNGGNDIELDGYKLAPARNPLPSGYDEYTDAAVQRLIKSNPSAVPEEIEAIVIRAGEDEDLKGFAQFLNRDEIDWLAGDRCVVLKDTKKVYAVAIWNKNETSAELVSVKGCNDDKLREFRAHAIGCIRRDIENPQINEAENDVPVSEIKVPLSRTGRESR